MNEEADQAPTGSWTGNYFNYFTEIEEHFQKARGSALFLLSPLDWALIENWKNAGIPLESVLKGIDAAFEKWRSQKQRRRLINSLAYCTQAVLEAAQRGSAPRQSSSATPPFSSADLQRHLSRTLSELQGHPGEIFAEVSRSLQILSADAEQHMQNLEQLERRLTVLEEKLVAGLRASQSEEQLYQLREQLDVDLKPYRGKMSADQISMLEKRYLETALLDRAKVPRLSLFYLH